MEPEIIQVEKINLIGFKINTTLSENNTANLWSSFMKRVAEINNRTNDNYYSIQRYPDNIDMESFTPITEFEKWAAVAVAENTVVPLGMKALSIEDGRFAKFRHKGLASDFFRTSQYIFGTWLPSSGFALRTAHHFEIMSSDYKGPNDPNSEEDVFIPIK